MNEAGHALRDELRATRQALIDRFQKQHNVERLLRGLSGAVDRVLRRAVRHTGLERNAAVIAVGGYGRAALFPHSDVDILIVPTTELDASTQARIEQLVGLLWDLGCIWATACARWTNATARRKTMSRCSPPCSRRASSSVRKSCIRD